jgi:hypothetical protein
MMTPSRRRTLELAKTDLAERIERTHASAHRQLLQRALDDIDRQLREDVPT